MALGGEYTVFQDRQEAGRKLAERLHAYANRNDVVVLGIPRGGVPVAFEVARALRALLDIFLSRKLGVRGQEEFGFGAIATGGRHVLDREIIEAVGISEGQIEQITPKVKKELERRENLYRGAQPPLRVEGLTVLLIRRWHGHGLQHASRHHGIMTDETGSRRSRGSGGLPVNLQPTRT